MIKGMTGFGAAQFSVGKTKGAVEIKSVNHRFLDLAFYLPVGFGSTEGKIRSMIAKQLSRGRVTVSIRISDKPSQRVVFNEAMVQEYIKWSKVLQKKYALKNDLTLSDLIGMPGVVDVKEVFVDADDMWPSVERGLRQAMKSLTLMREREGRSLVVDINDKLKKMSERLKTIQKRSAEILKSRQHQMKPEEFSSFQKSIDVNEEVSRFYHYIGEVRKILKSDVPVGKQIDFVAQEMQRETNTLGSKLQDDVVTNAVVALKSKVEKIREQANNIE